MSDPGHPWNLITPEMEMEFERGLTHMSEFHMMGVAYNLIASKVEPLPTGFHTILQVYHKLRQAVVDGDDKRRDAMLDLASILEAEFPTATAKIAQMYPTAPNVNTSSDR